MRAPTSACVVVVLLLASCGPNSAGQAVRPEAPTAREGLAEPADDGPCRDPGERGTPLVVDWSTQDRMDLEEAMLDGVAVVEYRCKKLSLVRGCRAEGSYGFLGLSKREEVVQLTDADEVRANLPMSAASVLANVGADLRRGRALDLAMVHSGKVRTTSAGVSRGALQGASCSAATHVIRGAFVGAFAMTTGTKGQVRAAAEIFGAGTSAESASDKRVERRDGEIGACGDVKPGQERAPEKCASVIRLELVALADGAAPAAPAGPVPKELAAEMSCPPGLVASGGKCTAAPTAPYRCSGTDLEECRTQCDRGEPSSCTIAALLERDPAAAKRLHERACNSGVAYSCSRLGVAYFYGDGTPKDSARAARYFELSCAAGDADGCNNLGAVLDMGTGIARDQTRAATLFTASCNGGDAQGCFNAMVSFRDGRGVRPEPSRAALYMKRAESGRIVDLFASNCRSGNAYSCWGLGYLHEHGLLNQPKSDAQALELYRRSCPGVKWGCDSLAALQARRR